MLAMLKAETNKTYTENGALTHASTGSDCLNLFATIGALRSADAKTIESRFARAWAENPEIALRILFYARDIRGGLGERQVFRTLLHWLANAAPATVGKNLAHIAEYGRYDDVLFLFDTPCEAAMLAYVKEQLLQDLELMKAGKSISLLAKWLRAVN